jgi:ABC-2 type transport system permease protein
MDAAMLTKSVRLFLVWGLSDLVTSTGGVFAMLLLAERFDGIGSWTKTQIVFMLGYSALVTGVVAMLFGYNVLFISRRVGRGQMDHVLVQPQPVWMTLATEGFAPIQGVAAIVPAVVLMAWSAPGLPADISPAWLAALAANLAASCAVVAAFMYAVGALAFWAPRGAEEISSSAWALTYSLKPFPMDGAPAPLRAGVLSFIPVGLVAWLPCRYLAGLDARPSSALLTPAIAAVLSVFAFVCFRKGLDHYGRTGSQRYSGWGHRS